MIVKYLITLKAFYTESIINLLQKESSANETAVSATTLSFKEIKT